MTLIRQPDGTIQRIYDVDDDLYIRGELRKFYALFATSFSLIFLAVGSFAWGVVKWML